MTSPSAPAWQQNRLFRFLASLQLAMLLLGVLIVASIAGTLYESSFDAKVAGAYIYSARWFNLWLLLLAINLIASAFSRMPWQKQHTGFLLTHLGIILLLLGSMIGRHWGIEGTMILFKGEPPSHLLTIDQRVLQISENETAAHVVPLEFIHQKPTPARPRDLLRTGSGWEFAAIGATAELEVKTDARPVDKGVPALHLTLSTAMMGQHPDAWLFLDDAHETFDLGLTSVHLKKGVAPASAPAETQEPVEIEESIFAFAASPADQVAKTIKGGSTGAKVTLVDVANGKRGRVLVQWNGREQSFDLAANLGKTVPLPESPFQLSIQQYWPDFRIKDGKPISISNEPNNACILITLRGRAVPAPSAETKTAGNNSVTVYLDEKGGLSYQLSSRKNGISSGPLVLGVPLVTGWADWQLVVDQVLPSAEPHFAAQPAATGKTEGVLIRARRDRVTVEQWVPFGWQISLPTSPKPMLVGYGLRQQPLPIGLTLTDFEVERNEGTDSPAGFKSTLEIASSNGDVATGQCWMNHPISYPASWLNTFSGFTYKISQASWNPENLSQSTVQILRDPGWGLKWTGSLIIVAGIFSLFYLRPPASAPTNEEPPAKRPEPERAHAEV